MTTFFEEMLTCPVCAETFEVPMVGSCGSEGQDEDFCPQYWGANPLSQLIHSCPQCRFTAFIDEFEEGAVTGKQKTSLQSALKKLPSETDMLIGANKYETAALCFKALGRNEFELADIYLKGSWCCRLDGDEHESELQRKAVELFEQALEKSLVPQEELAMITYLVGELYRRLDETKKAGEYYNRASKLANQPEWLPELIKKQSALL